MTTEPDQEYHYDFNPYSLPKAMLQAIGLATASAAQTEDLVQMAIAGCLGLDSDYGKVITLHMAMPLRFSALRAAAEIRIDDLDVLDELDDLIAEIEKAFERRNAIVHHQWCIDKKTREIFINKEIARTSYRSDLIPMTVAQVEKDALLIYRVGMKVWGFCKRNNLIPQHAPFRPRAHKAKAARKKRRELILKSQKS